MARRVVSRRRQGGGPGREGGRQGRGGGDEDAALRNVRAPKAWRAARATRRLLPSVRLLSAGRAAAMGRAHLDRLQMVVQREETHTQLGRRHRLVALERIPEVAGIRGEEWSQSS